MFKNPFFLFVMRLKVFVRIARNAMRLGYIAQNFTS